MVSVALREQRYMESLQARRFGIGRAFQDARVMSEWRNIKPDSGPPGSWHRHMAWVMMAMQFMLQAPLDHIDTHPLLSCYDVQILLATRAVALTAFGSMRRWMGVHGASTLPKTE